MIMSLTDTLTIEMTREQQLDARKRQRDRELLNRRIKHTQALLEALRNCEADVIAFNNELIVQRAALEGSELPRDAAGSEDPERFDGLS
jgi:hypothetical protein